MTALKGLKTLLLPLIITILFFSSPDASFGAALIHEEDPVEISADKITHDRETNILHAAGHVTVTQGEVTISADTIIFDRGKDVITAEGHIDGSDEGGNLLSGDKLTFDVKRSTSVIINGRLFFKGENVYITGDEIRKTGSESYEVERGIFTTCDCDRNTDPPWSVYSKSADVTIGEYLKAWHNFLSIKGVPVLYFPYFAAPIKRERQSGFLFPGAGHSSLRGVMLYNSLFWAISRNTDATLFLDVETQRGLGTGLEYRYIRRVGSEGEFYFYHFMEKDIDRVRSFRADETNLSRPETADNSRFILKYSHREQAPFGFVFKADINIVSDDEYFLDFGVGDERSLESLESTLSLSRNWHDYNLVIEFRLFDNLLVGDDGGTLQKLPVVTFTRTNLRLFGAPLYLSLESSFVNFERKEGIEGQRVDVHPRLSLPMNLGGYVEITPSIAPQGTFYWDRRNTEGRYQDRFIYEAKVDITTTFVKVASLSSDSDGLEKVRHTIRPRLTYTYTPDVAQDSLPSFDAVDRIAHKSEVAYSLNSILTGRFSSGGSRSYRDFLYFDISQSYNVVEGTRKITGPTDKRRPLSDLKGEIIIDPSERFTVSARGRYDVYDGMMEDYDTSVALKDSRGDRLEIQYRFIKDSTEFIDIGAGIKVTTPLNLSYRNRFSIDGSKSIETVYGLSYAHQCWSGNFTYTRKLDENIVLLTFDLLGIGNVGSFGSAFGGE
ncbi:MAG: LPS-assembly protein LptD [Thermodesulfobacteriota bacterium]